MPIPERPPAGAAFSHVPSSLLSVLLRRLLPWLLLLSGLPAQAQPVARLADEQELTRWSVAEGAPADIWTMRYAPDSKLWLGTGMGLFRFDGVQFERYPFAPGQRLPASNINALLLERGDEIWLGFHNGGVSRLKDGRVQSWGREQGLPEGRVLRLARTGDGMLWAATRTGLARFDGQRWRRIGAAQGFTDDEAYYVFVDRRDTLWVCGARVLARLPAGAQRFIVSPRRIGRDAVLNEDRQGRVWLSEPLGGTGPLTDARGEELPLPPARPAPAPLTLAKQLLFAQDGSLWLTSVSGGVVRLPGGAGLAEGQRLEAGQPGLQRFRSQDGLMADAAVPLAEDDEGGVWVGTNYGLGGFRARRLRALPELASVGFAGFVVTPFGDGVLAGGGDGLLAVDPPAAPQHWPGGRLARVLAPAGPGGAWMLDSQGLARVSATGVQPVTLPQAGRTLRSAAAAPDRSGGLWLSLVGGGVWHVRADGRAERLDSLPADLGEVQLLDAAPDGTLWLGAADQLLQLGRDGRLRRYGRAEGLRLGFLSAIATTATDTFVAGHGGFARLVNGGFAQVDAELDDAFGSITGIVADESGGLWLNGARGVVHLDRGTLTRLAEPGVQGLDRLVLDSRDGLPGIALQAAGSSTALRDARGRLWFVTNRGVAWLDPAQLQLNRRPPGVEILSLRSGDNQYRPTEGLELPAGTRSLAVRFTAQTLAAADRARFRYRLEGADNRWQELGAQRELLITNLGPGSYRLHLMAANGDGVWSQPGLSYGFSVAPQLWQTWPFLGGVLLLLALAAGLAYRLRLRALTRGLALRLEERHAERERIARELHDTLMQGLQGLLLSFHVVMNSVQESRTRAQLEQALRRAEALITEGRDRVWALRGNTEGDLASTLGLIAHELLEGGSPLDLQQHGQPRALDPLARDALLCIGREAILNAVRHAGMSRLEVALGYESWGCWLRVRDDGCGLDPAAPEPGVRPLHFGLTGMRERALQLGGELHIRSGPGQGTEVLVELPAAQAYAQPPGLWRRWWRHRAG